MPSPPPRRPHPAAPQPTPTQRQREVAKLLMRLDGMLKKAGDLAAIAQDRVSVGGLSRYRAFTRKVRDFFALAAVTQERLDASPAEMADLAATMTTALERMHARMVVLFVESSGVFFTSFARVKALPIGTHEICGLELRGVIEIRKFLDDPLYDGERGQKLRDETDRIAGLIRMVMNRIPPLPDFGDEPSVGPRGGINQPLRPPRRAADRPAPAQAPAPAVPPPQRAFPAPGPAQPALPREEPAAPAPDPRLEVRSLSLDDLEEDEPEEDPEDGGPEDEDY